MSANNSQPELFAPLERELMVAEIDAVANSLQRVWHEIPERAKAEFWNLEKSITAFRKRCIGQTKISEAVVPHND